MEIEDKKQMEEKKNDQFAKRMIEQALIRVLKGDKGKLLSREEIKEETEGEILAILANKDITDAVEKEMQLVMQRFNNVFDLVYDKVLEKQQKQETIQEKSARFNEMIRNYRDKDPKEYLDQLIEAAENPGKGQLTSVPKKEEKPKKTIQEMAAKYNKDMKKRQELGKKRERQEPEELKIIDISRKEVPKRAPRSMGER